MTQSAIHTHRVAVRWADFDRYGHLMNANYVEIAQEARLAWAEHNFFSQGREFAAFVRHLDIDFRKPVEPEGTTELQVDSQVVEIGNTSFVTRQEIKDKHGSVACVVECVQVAVDVKTQKPRPLTDEEKAILVDADETDDATEVDSGLGDIL